MQSNSKFKSARQDSHPSSFHSHPIEQTTITRNYKHLTSIPVPSTPNILHLHLAHNQINSLLNIQLFPNLQSFNISHNQLTSINEFKAVVNKEKLVRLSVRCNRFQQYGYQERLAEMFPKLVELDHIKLNKRQVIEKQKEYVKDNFVKCFYIIERLTVMMASFEGQTRINQTINKTAQQLVNESNKNQNSVDTTFHKKGMLKLLYENISQKSIYQLTNIVTKTSNLQNLQHSSLLQVIVKIIEVILVSDVKCTCRPFNLRKALLKSYGEIVDSMMTMFSQLFNTQLQKYIQKKLTIKNNPNLKTDQRSRQMERLVEFSRLQPQNVKIMDTLDYKKYFEKQTITIQSSIKVDRSTPNQFKLTTKPEQYLINKNKQQREKEEKDNSPDQFLFRFPVFAYSPDYLFVMASMMKNKIEPILQMHNTLVFYETNKTRIGNKKINENKIIQRHSRSRSFQHQNDRKSTSTKARTTLYKNENTNYINEISFQKTLPQSTKQDDIKTNSTKVINHKKTWSQSIPQLPVLSQPVTAQKLYEYALKYKTFGALILNVKQSQYKK